MLRRDARLRREYLHRKGLEGQEREVYNKKRKVKEALESGKPIPTELRKEGRELKAQIQLDDARTSGQQTPTTAIPRCEGTAAGCCASPFNAAELLG